jgi:hypothetical protein
MAYVGKCPLRESECLDMGGAGHMRNPRDIVSPGSGRRIRNRNRAILDKLGAPGSGPQPNIMKEEDLGEKQRSREEGAAMVELTLC